MLLLLENNYYVHALPMVLQGHIYVSQVCKQSVI